MSEASHTAASLRRPILLTAAACALLTVTFVVIVSAVANSNPSHAFDVTPAVLLSLLFLSGFLLLPISGFVIMGALGAALTWALARRKVKGRELARAALIGALVSGTLGACLALYMVIASIVETGYGY